MRIWYIICLLLITPCSQVLSEDDTECLREIKNSITDPNNQLSDWTFGNITKGYVCSFTGVTCWNALENKVLGLKLQNRGLSGSFPSGLGKCTSLQTLDFSNNAFSGSIPGDICNQIPYVTVMDLSQNSFSGSIPADLGNCKYLNSLSLQQNRLSGELPWGIGTLTRLSSLNVSDNSLSGPVPASYTNRTSMGLAEISSLSLDDNPGLCGPPLQKSCNSASKIGIIVAATVAGGLVFALICALFLWWMLLTARKKERTILRNEHKWAKRIKAPKSVTVLLFEKPIVKLRLSDLMAATNDFDKENIIETTRTGAIYKALLPDGSMLAVKRLSPSAQTEKQFKSEMDTIGKLRHRNLVPLLGYCIAGGEKLLVYKHMVNGTLKDCLHETPEKSRPDWNLRLKIGIGAARGMAWLHHSCNPRIIHRNISTNSILLDDEYEPRITDFGLARLMNPVDTHISTFVNGDFGDVGYVAPEYTQTLVATVKGDVYSFGVLLLELVTGQKANEVCCESEFKGNLAEWVLFLSNSGRVEESLDMSLTGRGHDNELKQFLKIACSCIAPVPKERPTMYEIYQMLRTIGQKFNITEHDELPANGGFRDPGAQTERSTASRGN